MPARLFAAIALVFLFCGCQAIMLKMYGIKNPKVEDHASIRKKAVHFDLDTTNIVTVRSENFLKEYAGNSLPDAAIFDAKGNYIEYRVTDTSCNAGLFDFIPALVPAGPYNKTAKTTLDIELAKFLDLDGRPIKPVVEPGIDFYVLIYWAVWEGRLNKDHVKAWEDLAKANQKAHIKVIKVDMDFQQYWSPEERQRILDKVSKHK